MIDSELLAILVCPESRSPLAEADETLLTKVNEAIRSGRLKNRSDHVLDAPISGGLVRVDGKLMYPVRDGIPVLLVDEAIPLDSL